jgi:hypothetical protein
VAAPASCPGLCQTPYGALLTNQVLVQDGHICLLDERFFFRCHPWPDRRLMLPIAPAGCITILIHPLIFSAPSNLQVMPPIVMLSNLSHTDLCKCIHIHVFCGGRLSRLMQAAHILAVLTCSIDTLPSKRLLVLCHEQTCHSDCRVAQASQR